MPDRVRLSRAKGWRMPENTVKVDRSTKWGNPFVVGKHGTAAECVEKFGLMLGCQIVTIPAPPPDVMNAYRLHFFANWRALSGRRLACWCKLDAPCHADVLAEEVEILCREESADA